MKTLYLKSKGELLEHKSYADKFGVFQVAGYIIDAWRKMREDGKEELPVVIPLIVYHGKPNWNYKKDIREMIPDFELLPEYLKQMLPVLRHEFISIGGYNEEDINVYQPLTRMVLRSFKYIYDDKDKLIEMFIISVDEIESEVTEEEFNQYIDIILLYYSLANKNISEEDIIRKIQELGGKGEKIMTILERREQKGIEKGIELGIEQGIEKGIERGKAEIVKDLIRAGIEMDLIVTASKLSREKIEKIKKEMLN